MKIMKKRLRIVKRFEKREKSRFPRFKIRSLFARSHLWKWIWGIGLILSLSLVFLLPPTKGIAFFNKLGMVILITFFVIIFFIYLWRFWPQFLMIRSLSLCGILIVSMALMGRIIVLLPQVPNYFIPIAFLSILSSLLFTPSLSILVTLLLSILFSVNAESLDLLPVLVMGGIVGAYSATFVHQRSDLTKGGLYVGISNVLVILAVGLLGNYSFVRVASFVVWGMGSGIFSSILALTVLPYLETYFGITTDIKLLELSNLNLPLLNRLSIEAPGTYHHTMMVASLSEAGAEAVGANSLLARVGAYYHDVGKILRPHFFFENAGASKNSYHDKMAPNLSSIIVVSHVKDGVELAQRNRLPQVVIDILRQHHGTGLIAHFYREALMERGKEKDSIHEENFRYPGPKPQTKESAIVMLADSVEAAFRFSPQKTLKRIHLQVKKVVNNKLKDNQLDECNLTLGEIARMSDAFVRTLTGVIHTRGRYPEEMLKSRSVVG
ncbi:MAG: HD family phosphohydrolase [bacterium]